MTHVVAWAALLGLLGCATGSAGDDADAGRSDAMRLPDGGPQIDGGVVGHIDSGNVILAPVINEFVASHTGTDNCEFVEIAGEAATDLADLSVVVLEGDAGAAPGAGAVDHVIAVEFTDGNGLWASASVTDQLENGTQTLMLVRGWTGALDADLDTDDDGVLDDEPWDEVLDAVAVRDTSGASDRTYGGATNLAANFDGGAVSVGGASRVPDGADSGTPADWVRNDFDGDGLGCGAGTASAGEALNTPGDPNTVQL